MAILTFYHKSFLKKIIRSLVFLYLCTLSYAQNIYQGEIGFNYNGTVNGSFTSITEDSLVTAISINQVVNDTALLVMASITQQGENEFDLFLAVLKDTIYPIQPRNWEIPGEGDENNPLSLESILVFVPQLDSSFVEDFFEFFTDTSGNQEIDEIFNDVFSSFSDNLYLGLGGNLEVEVATDSTLIGTFNTTMIKPVFYFPPHTVSINNGTFELENLDSPILKAYSSYNPAFPEISMSPSYPNPFNPKTKIQLNVHSPIKNVLAKIYNSNGQQISTIYSGPLKEGLNSFLWEPKDIASGMYVLVIKTPFSVQSQKLLYLK